jgi:hypothetical protein
LIARFLMLFFVPEVPECHQGCLGSMYMYWTWTSFIVGPTSQGTYQCWLCPRCWEEIEMVASHDTSVRLKCVSFLGMVLRSSNGTAICGGGKYKNVDRGIRLQSWQPQSNSGTTTQLVWSLLGSSALSHLDTAL